MTKHRVIVGLFMLAAGVAFIVLQSARRDDDTEPWWFFVPFFLLAFGMMAYEVINRRRGDPE